MKSIMQEASSIMKAIEQGWKNAGMPKEFSIKIFEEPKKNFIGLTVQAAKIGIFFTDTVHPHKKIETQSQQQKRRHVSPTRHAPKTTKQSYVRDTKPVAKPTTAPIQEKLVTPEQAEPTVQQPREARQPKEIWSSAMLDTIRVFFTNILHTIHKSDVNFHLESHAYILTIQYDKPVVTPDKQYQFDRSCSFLLMYMLRHHMKRPLRGFKINIQHS